jgi:hypothetical protein
MSEMVEKEMSALRDRRTHIFARAEHDFYVEPEWVSERLFEAERFEGPIHDPACGIGRIAIAATAAGYVASGSDINIGMLSFTWDFHYDYVNDMTPSIFLSNNIVSNPPFGKARQFIERAIREARKVAMFLPARFMFGVACSQWLASTHPRRIYHLVPRPSVPPGKLVLSGMKPMSAKEDSIWIIWEQGYSGAPEMGWLRKKEAQ